ncbi:MAG: hypothetical protein ACI379_00390 [Nocardioides sp.]|uniref:hypothetical protein n=1 Tax=Nocardioides sp. TaxID=35761 RepID=UPI003EFE05BB
MSALRVPLLMAAAVLLLASCGTEESSSAGSPEETPTTTSPASGLPACDEVWVEGADLPRAYEGCESADGPVEPEVVQCSSGQRIVLYADAYWAVRGHLIKHAPDGLKDDPGYADTMQSCRA